MAAAHHLRTKTVKTVEGRAKLGIEAFAEVRKGRECRYGCTPARAHFEQCPALRASCAEISAGPLVDAVECGCRAQGRAF